MKIYFQRNKKFLVDITLFVNVGAIDDTKKGVSHLVEHLILSSKNKVVQELEKRNIYVNGATSQDSIIFTTSILKKDLCFVVRKLKELVFSWSFDKDVFELEKAIITEEIYENSSSLERLGFIGFLSSITNVDIHEERGTVEDLKKLDKKDVVEYYDKHFVEDNSIISISDNISLALKLKLRKQLKTKKLPNDFKRVEIASKKDEQKLGLQTAHVFFVTNNYGMFSENRLLYEIFLMVYFSNFSKLWEETRNKDGLCYYIDYENLYIKNFGFATAQIDVSTENVQILKNMIEKILNVDCITKERFLKAKECLYLRICEDYHKNINMESILRKKLFNKKYRLSDNIKALKQITFEDFVGFSKNVLNEYSILIQS